LGGAAGGGGGGPPPPASPCSADAVGRVCVGGRCGGGGVGFLYIFIFVLMD
jgi:hypothetical protein